MTPEVRAAWMKTRVKHGAYLGGRETPTHYIWRGMHARRSNPKQRDFPNYGGRGITVCKRWNKYERFLADMGDRPAHLSLERVDNNRGYCKSNCMWATHSQQQSNKATTKWFANDKFTGTSAQCAAYVGISRALACWRWKMWGTFVKGQAWRELQKQ